MEKNKITTEEITSRVVLVLLRILETRDIERATAEELMALAKVANSIKELLGYVMFVRDSR